MRTKRIFFNRAPIIGWFLMAAVVLLAHVPVAYAASGNNALKIYEVAGAGGSVISALVVSNVYAVVDTGWKAPLFADA